MSNVQEMVDKLGENKYEFLNDVEASIRSHIKYKSWQQCLTIVSRNSDGGVWSTYKPAADLTYAKVLIEFLQHKKHGGRTLDSGLTDGIVELVGKKFEDYYRSNSSSLTGPLLKCLLDNQIFVNALSKQIAESFDGYIAREARKRLAAELVHVLKDHLENSLDINFGQIAGTALIKAITAAVTFAASVPIASSVMAALLKSIALSLKGVIIKILASSAFKTMFITLIKKVLIAKIIAIIITFIATTLGISSIPAAWVLLPLLAALIAYQVSTLPDQMSEKVSVSVRNALSDEFDKLNGNVVNQILKSLSSDVLCALASDIASDREFKNALRKLA